LCWIHLFAQAGELNTLFFFSFNCLRQIACLIIQVNSFRLAEFWPVNYTLLSNST
jgi:hypothetical protein